MASGRYARAGLRRTEKAYRRVADAVIRRDQTLATAMGALPGALIAERFAWRTQAWQLATYYNELVRVRPCRS